MCEQIAGSPFHIQVISGAVLTMTDIVLIRHGETAWNAEARLQGHLDIGLNANGVAQARRVAQALASEPFAAIVASDLQRARQTADAIALERNLPVTLDRALRERCFGGFEGLLYDDIEAHFPQDYLRWKAREIDARYPPGVHAAETLREFSARSLAAVISHASDHPAQTIAIVTHGGVLDCVYRAACQIGLERPRDFDIMNTGVNRFRWDGSALQLVSWGDVRHLGADMLDELA